MAEQSWFQKMFGSPDKFPTDDQFLKMGNTIITNAAVGDALIKSYKVKNGSGTYDTVHQVNIDYDTNGIPLDYSDELRSVIVT